MSNESISGGVNASTDASNNAAATSREGKTVDNQIDAEHINAQWRAARAARAAASNEKAPAAEKTAFFDDNFKRDAVMAFKAGLCGAITMTPIILTMALLGRVLSGGKSEA